MPYRITGRLGGNKSPSEPDALIMPMENRSGYPPLINMGTKRPPNDRMVSPLPAQVKMAQTTAVVITRPPGIQPKSAE